MDEMQRKRINELSNIILQSIPLYTDIEDVLISLDELFYAFSYVLQEEYKKREKLNNYRRNYFGLTGFSLN